MGRRTKEGDRIMSELRPYQMQLLEEVRQSYREGARRPCIVLPCGGGKSCIRAEVAKCATDKGNRVLFLVHRKELVEQIIQTFYN
ncbi:MAG: DEAD/DEAH box helicase family protein, partial [Butyricicoccus sp.]